MNKIRNIFVILAAVLCMVACSKEDALTSDGYGYMQVRLQKNTSRGLIEGNPLEHLRDAKKIRLSLQYNGKTIEQTLNLLAVSDEAAEYVLTSEDVTMRCGRYKVLGYALYGDYKGGDMAELLQVVSMDGDATFSVERDQLTEYDFYVEAKEYGKFSAHIIRLEPETRAGSPVYSEMFDYDDIDSVQLILERSVAGVVYREDRKVKAYAGRGDAPVFDTDSIDLQTGEYRISHFELFNKRRQFMYAQDVDVPFTVRHFELSKSSLGVQLPETAGVHDGIALKQIWDAMDGEHWSSHERDAYGANWVFKLSDGSPRPLSAWVNQPGVTLSTTGRVITLNLGTFNPLGMVPDAIGRLDALERLYLGSHTDETYFTPEGVGGSGTHTGSFAPSNRITGISEEIGKLKNLTELYIANSMIEKLPASMSQLSNVTDLELYNNPFTELDGEVFRGMTYLTAVNIDKLYNLSESQLHSALNKMCDYCQKIQLLYLCNLKLTTLPSHLNRLTDLRLLDVSRNKISSIPSLLPLAPVQVILDHNELTSLPADLFNMDDIESFSCSDNKLKEFPAVLSNLKGLYSFESVNLSGNRMHGFQEGFEGIRCEKLIMSANYMGHLPGETTRGFMPEEFAKTKSVINYLDLAYNNIDTIRNAAIIGMKSLQALDLSKNELRYLPSAFNAENLPYLTGLDLSHNQFRGFPSNVLNVISLQQLLIADQGYFRDMAETQWVRTMTQWPDYLHLHPSLTNVDMSGNDFREVTNFPANLVTLKVTNNPHIKLTVPRDVQYRMKNGTYVLYYDEGQDVSFE